jgi:hypothetical protein
MIIALDVLLTDDKCMKYQEHLARLLVFTLIVLACSNRIDDLVAAVPGILAALAIPPLRTLPRDATMQPPKRVAAHWVRSLRCLTHDLASGCVVATGDGVLDHCDHLRGHGEGKAPCGLHGNHVVDSLCTLTKPMRNRDDACELVC